MAFCGKSKSQADEMENPPCCPAARGPEPSWGQASVTVLHHQADLPVPL